MSSQVAPIWVGQPVPPPSASESRRIVSISDPWKSSAGSRLFFAYREQESEALASLFCALAVSALFRKNPPLTWVTSRSVTQWRSRYVPTTRNRLMIISALAAEIKLGPERIGERTDGGLQIILPQDGDLIAWDRSYYEIALEVFRPS